MYGYVPYPAPPSRTVPCAACEGAGVTGELYARPVDAPDAPIRALLVDTFCPACQGCGSSGEHAECGPGDHAHDETDEDEVDEDAGPVCLSCQGRGWWPLQGHDEAGDGDGTVEVLLRMPCGCTEDRVERVHPEDVQSP